MTNEEGDTWRPEAFVSGSILEEKPASHIEIEEM